jgi:hypothetical protein
MKSISWNVCKVASAANDTLRLARDFRRASRLSRSSLSRAAACCSSSVLTAILCADRSSPEELRALCVVFVSPFALFSIGISGKGATLGFKIPRGAFDGTANDYISESVQLSRSFTSVRVHTARRFPDPCFKASSPPGPKLLLLDFFLLAAVVLATSIVAFSFSVAFCISNCDPIDLRVRRVAGTVISPCDDILILMSSQSPNDVLVR